MSALLPKKQNAFEFDPEPGRIFDVVLNRRRIPGPKLVKHVHGPLDAVFGDQGHNESDKQGKPIAEKPLPDKRDKAQKKAHVFFLF
jgi:hypothetical protein